MARSLTKSSTLASARSFEGRMYKFESGIRPARLRDKLRQLRAHGWAEHCAEERRLRDAYPCDQDTTWSDVRQWLDREPTWAEVANNTGATLVLIGAAA